MATAVRYQHTTETGDSLQRLRHSPLQYNGRAPPANCEGNAQPTFPRAQRWHGDARRGEDHTDTHEMTTTTGTNRTLRRTAAVSTRTFKQAYQTEHGHHPTTKRYQERHADRGKSVSSKKTLALKFQHTLLDDGQLRGHSA